VTVASSSLAAAFDDAGIGDDAEPAAGAFSATGRSFSAEALASVGITPGATITHRGVSFQWPSAAPGTPDNVESDGQVVAVRGTGDHLAFLGASTSGARGGLGTVAYTDGTTQQFTIKLADWWAPGPGDNVVATTPYTNGPAGRDSHKGSLYYASVPLTAEKQVAGVILPDTGAPPGAGMHVFAVAVGEEV
jgi:beta-glucosidase